MRPLLLLVLLLTSPLLRAEGFITRLLDHPIPGGVAVVGLGPADRPRPEARYDGKPVLIVAEDQQRWIAIVGIPLTAKAGSQSLQVTQDGLSRSARFQVGSKDYQTQHITLKNKRQVNPNPEDLKRINREMQAQNQAYARYSDRYPSNLLFDHPVEGRLSSPFGLRRFFNGEERNPHSGLDFAVGAGTPIKSPAAGEVILTGNLFFNGNTVFVDHGQGLISMFCHLSKISVREGDTLPRGGLVGQVGSTGRATGPHLHWNVSLNGNRVDPAIFIGQFKP